MRKIKANDIPIDTCYCTGCPYLKYKRTNYGYTGRKIPQEYCTYLHKYLSIQDEVKDCGIGEPDWEKLDEQESLEKIEKLRTYWEGESK